MQATAIPLIISIGQCTPTKTLARPIKKTTPDRYHPARLLMQKTGKIKAK